MASRQDQHRNASFRIQTQTTWDGKHIPHQTQQTIPGDCRSRRCKPGSRPDEYVVCQAFQPQQHRLRGKTLLVATPQSLLVLLETRLDASATRVIEVGVGQQDGSGVASFGSRRPGKGKYLRPGERREQYAELLLSLFGKPTQGDAHQRTLIFAC